MRGVRHISKWRGLLVGIPALAVLLLAAASASGASAPIKLGFAGDFGREVNLTEAGKGAAAEDICLVETGDICRAGKSAVVPGSFSNPRSTAVDKSTGDVYVADQGNRRIDKFGPDGEFLFMWGWKVNKNGTNVCTAAEVAECQAGTSGGAAEQMSGPQSVAVDNYCFEKRLAEPTCKETDPSNGDVYVVEQINKRVDEFAPDGKFVLMFGGEVNKNGGNVCTAAESAECRAGASGTGNGFFAGFFPLGQGNLIAVGGPNHVVYVGDEGRVQEFDSAGVYREQLTLTATTPAFPATGKVTGVTVDGAGDIYTTESYAIGTNASAVAPRGVYEFAPGDTTATKAIDTTDEKVEGLALDESGHLAVTVNFGKEGLLLDLSETAPETKFTAPFQMKGAIGLSFDAKGDLYLGDSGQQDVERYVPLYGATLLSGAPLCVEGAAHGSDATMDCTLHGEVDPWGVKETEAWFQWGTTNTLGQETAPKQAIANTQSKEGVEEATTPVSARISGLRPNETIFDRLAVSNHNFPSSEALTDPLASFATPTVAPRIEAAPATAFVHSGSIVLEGALNPENAQTRYWFEYGRCASLGGCPQAVSTESGESNAYGTADVSQEVTGLSPATTYRVRLVGENEDHQKTEGPETTFTTGAAPQPSAQTGGYANLGSTSATITATVNPEGVPASYAFELGVYEGEKTQYGVVFAGSPGMGTTPVGEELALTGLQPGTTYAYRVSVTSGYLADHTRYGATVTFTTLGLPAAIGAPSALTLLPVPAVKFPSAAKASRPSRAKCAKGRRRNKRGVCVKVKRKKRRRH